MVFTDLKKRIKFSIKIRREEFKDRQKFRREVAQETRRAERKSFREEAIKQASIRGRRVARERAMKPSFKERIIKSVGQRTSGGRKPQLNVKDLF